MRLTANGTTIEIAVEPEEERTMATMWTRSFFKNRGGLMNARRGAA